MLKLPQNPYPIIIGKNSIRLLPGYLRKLKVGDYAYLLTNESIKKLYANLITKTIKPVCTDIKLTTVADSEKSKSLRIFSRIIEDLASQDRNKRPFIIALGGGVIGDLSGFIAATYKRGIPYIQIPTTLLAQVDSAIGGKTALDLKEGKNLVGAFYHPRLVVNDVSLLLTLNAMQIRSGLAEVIKYAVIKDARLFRYLENNYKSILDADTSALEFIVSRCAAIKAEIVRLDEREGKGIRTILNFGHTIGHAIEAAQLYRGYNHGQAISLGMLCACDISRKLSLLDGQTSNRIERLIKSVGLPTKMRDISLDKIINAYYHDKKFRGSKNRFVLITGIGKTVVKEGIGLPTIREVLKERGATV